MKITLNITGHVHDYPDRQITHCQSWPMGVTTAAIAERIKAFSKAFVVKEHEIRMKKIHKH